MERLWEHFSWHLHFLPELRHCSGAINCSPWILYVSLCACLFATENSFMVRMLSSCWKMALSLCQARRKWLCDNSDTCWEDGQLLTGLIHGREAAASIFRRSPAGCWAVWSLLRPRAGDVSTAGRLCQGSRHVTQLGSCSRLLSLTRAKPCIMSVSPTTAPVGNPFM